MRVWWILLALLGLCAPAWAGPSDDVAGEAYEVHSQYCSETGAQANTTATAEAAGQVNPVWLKVDRVWNESGHMYLLYWRGILADCLNFRELAIQDLRYFLGSDPDENMFSALIRDARIRLRRMGEPAEALPPPIPAAGIVDPTTGEVRVASDEREWPILLMGVSGGYQLGVASKPRHNIALGFDVSVRLLKALRLAAWFRPAIGEPGLDLDGSIWTDDQGRQRRPLLLAFGVGPMLRFWTKDRMIRPFVRAGVALAPNPDGTDQADDQWRFLIGAEAAGGVDFRLGRAPVFVSPSGEAGFLGPHFFVRALVTLRISLG